VRSVRARRAADPVRRIVRTIVLQLAVNVALIVAIFLGAMAVQRIAPAWLEGLPPWTGGPKTVLCLAALVCSLPVVVAFLRKLQALSMLLSELAIREARTPRQKQALRTLLSNTILFAGAVAMSLLVLALSAPLLPPLEILLLLCALAALLALVLRAYCVRLYARAQTAIRETLGRTPSAHDTAEVPEASPAPPPARPLPPLLDEAELRTLVLPESAAAHGRTIANLGLRSRSGASIIAVRRGDKTRHNPEPHWVLEAGDELLLLGEGHQLDAAERMLVGPGL
jgi:CPA2 family monovalent cation:H+ antiporter-2